jgi:hypothetical protein
LAWAEYCYNTSFHTTLRATPFEVVYGRPPPPLIPYTPGAAQTAEADALLRTRDEILEEVRQRLLQAQQLSKKYYDAGHRDVEFAVGDWVCGCASSTAPPSPSSRAPRASLGLAMQGRSKSWSASGRWPIVCTCLRVLACTTCSMWGYSSRTKGRRPRLRDLFLLSRTVGFFPRQHEH